MVVVAHNRSSIRALASSRHYTRRGGLLLASTATILAPSPGKGEELSPFELSQGGLRIGLDEDGRVRSCSATTDGPNCLSTSYRRTGSYAPAWRTNGETLDGALASLAIAVSRTYGEARTIAKTKKDRGAYMAFSVGLLWGNGLLEFVIGGEGVGDRGWEGDKPGSLVTYRSTSQVVYLYPLTQPLGDFGQSQRRLNALREELGWSVVGCELIECYE